MDGNIKYREAAEFAAGYEICNAHCHIYPEKIAGKAVASIGGFYGIPMDCPVGDAKALISDGTPFGVEKYLVCSAATDPSQVESINTFIIGECRKHPEFIGFGTLHADYTGDFDREIQRCIDGGLKGIKLHPDFQRFNIDDKNAMLMYEAAEGRLPFLFHMGDARYDYSAPRRLAKVLDTFRNFEAFGAHLGGYSVWEDAQEHLRGRENLWFDCSSSLFAIPPEKAAGYIRSLGTDRVFFGTDFPMWDHAGELLRFKALPLTEEERRAILAGNFKRYFKLDTKYTA